MTDPKTDPLIGQLLDSLLLGATPADWVPPRPSLRAELLAATETASGQPPFPGFRRRFAQLFDLGVAQADTVLLQLSDAAAWFPIKTFQFHPFAPGPARLGAYAALVRCPPNQPFPLHRHLGAETTLFLRGSVVDEDSGKLLLPGDILTQPTGSLHRLTVLPPYECIFAVLMENGLPDFDP